MEYRYLGHSGLKISEITYGNWLTHGSQVENDVATQCVHAALDAGITTFDTADVYANTKAETVLSEALKGQRRAEHRLGPAAGVAVRGVEGRDAGVQGGVHAGRRDVVLHLRAVREPVAVGDF